MRLKKLCALLFIAVPTWLSAQASGLLRGRDAIEADYRPSLASAAARSGRHHTHLPESVRIQFVTPNVAVVEAATVSVGGRDPAGKPLPDWRVKLLTV
jgi:hypothetical protein